ncbi:MAG: hypothetical protein JXR94_00645 [Candidatus Hydrogenedentes bacterium]|nr:hypothetical protein [Candidatus Hydrogenedentota bacterium]
MNARELLVRMLQQLLQDTQVLHQQGAGYFSCIPIARRYNKLLGQARELSAGTSGLLGTFEDAPEADPKDPAEKMKVVQGIRIEINQLISLLEALAEESA